MGLSRSLWDRTNSGEVAPEGGGDIRVSSHLKYSDVNRRSAGGGNITLSTDDAFVQSVDPGGAIGLTLPAGGNGLSFRVANRGASTEDITVQDGTGSTIATVGPGDWGAFVHDGTVWLGGAASGQVV